MRVWSPPALGLVDDRAVLALGSYDHNLYALDALSGEELWRFTTGGGVYAAPLLWRDGDARWAFVASSDGLVYGLDARQGQRRWIHSVEAWRPSFGGARLGSPCLGTVGGSVLLLVSYWVWDRSLAQGQQESGVLALDARSGALRWRTPLGEGAMSAPLLVEHAGQSRIAVGGSDGRLSLLDAAAGQILWQRTELDAIRSSAAFAVIDGEPSLFYLSTYGMLRRVRLDDGAERWQYKIAERTAGAPVLAPVQGRLLVVMGALDRTLHAVDARDGTRVWRYGARAGLYESAAFLDDGAAGLLVSAAWDHHLHGVAAQDGVLRFLAYTGRPLWDILSLEDSAGSPPLLARLGGQTVVFLGSYSGVLYALPVASLANLGPAVGLSNAAFWVSLPLVMGLVAGLALWLTRRQRAARA
jgi:outer membrane protein assembly factor BamB